MTKEGNAISVPAETLLDICRYLVDPKARTINLHAGHNHTIALRVATTAGEVIVKMHRGSDRHRQEIHAYTHWVSALGGRAPKLLAVSDDPPAIVISALPGHTLADTKLTAQWEAEAHRQAGAILRALHESSPPADEPDMTHWLADRGNCWLAHARHLLPHARRAEIRAHPHALSALGPIPAVPCHLDYTPRNLLCCTDNITDSPPTRRPAKPDDRGSDWVSIAAIDFEHARYDLAARDLVRMATRVWNTRPDLEQAFLHGYGPLGTLDREIINHCSHLDTLTSAVRAAQRQSATDRNAG
jgi:Ser/Thr protein kinase RdoA (MazF antagonist)